MVAAGQVDTDAHIAPTVTSPEPATTSDQEPQQPPPLFAPDQAAPDYDR